MFDDDGNGTDEKEGKGDDSAAEAMQKAITSLADNQGDLSKGLEALSANVVSLTQRLEQKADSDDDEDDDPGDDDDLPDDLESLTMKQVIALMDKRSEQREARLIKSFKDEVGEAGKKADNVSLQAELAAVKANHDDFNDWKEDLGAVARVSPSLSIEDMYVLAKAKNPEKVAKLIEAKKKADEDKGDDDNSGKTRRRYGGGESRKGGDESRKTNMTQKDAGSAAFDEIFGA